MPSPWFWLAVSVCLCAGSAIAADRPNIILIFSDDHAYQAISAYGESRKLIQTPGIDRIARGGMRFDRCLVPNSICGPSRACVLTGKYSHRNGFYNNTNSRFDGSQVTFPKLLQAAGYQTAFIGKWHLGSDPTGFDHWHILPGQGIYYNPEMIRDGQKVRHIGYVTDLISDFSLDWLRKRDRKKPFLLMTQHKAPHREWAPALRHLGHNGNRIYPEPETLFDDYAQRGVAVKDQDMTLEKTIVPLDMKLVPPPGMDAEQRKFWDAYYQPRNEKFREEKLTGSELVRWRYQRYMHDYLGCVKAVDEAVDHLLNYIDEDGLAENTIVVYASDQGFYLGEHGWFDKRWVFEESLRTPLLIRWPGVTRPGSISHQITSLLDLSETFLDAAGLPVDPEMQGRSLLPILRGESPADWRNSFYYEYFEYPQPHQVMPHYGVVTDRYKLVRFYVPQEAGPAKPDYWELYDRQTDPQELQNRYQDSRYQEVVKELHAELERLRRELKVPEQTPREAYGNLFQEPRKKNK